MNKISLIENLEWLSKLKQQEGFSIIDTHVHPIDVMGTENNPNINNEKSITKKQDYLKPGLLEIFNYGKIAVIGTDITLKILPNLAANTIKNIYRGISQDKIVSEMNIAKIDKAILLPIEPWVSAEQIAAVFNNPEKFNILGSIDVHSISVNNVQKEIERQKQEYGIIGLKLHPSLQGFHPIPSHNKPPLDEILNAIYTTASINGLYLHFHTGKSFFSEKINDLGVKSYRSRNISRIINFVESDFSSELFSNYKIPMILAHAASYGETDFPADTIGRIKRRYDNIFFDTSGISVATAINLIKTVGPERIIFGSDGPYNRMAFNVAFLFESIIKTIPKNQQKNALASVFGKNFRCHVIKK